MPRTPDVGLIAFRGSQMSPGQAEAAEQRLRVSPGDAEANALVIGYQHARREYSLLLASIVSHPTWNLGAYWKIPRSEQPAYEIGKMRWRESVLAQGFDERVLKNVAEYFLDSEPEVGEAILVDAAITRDDAPRAGCVAGYYEELAARADSADSRVAFSRNAFHWHAKKYHRLDDAKERLALLWPMRQAAAAACLPTAVAMLREAASLAAEAPGTGGDIGPDVVGRIDTLVFAAASVGGDSAKS